MGHHRQALDWVKYHCTHTYWKMFVFSSYALFNKRALKSKKHTIYICHDSLSLE